MNIKVTRRFAKKWSEIVDATLDGYGRRQVVKNTERLEYLAKILQNNPKYGFPEPLLRNVTKHEYRSLLFFGPFKIVYYANASTVYLVDIWNMKMSPERLTRPYSNPS